MEYVSSLIWLHDLSYSINLSTANPANWQICVEYILTRSASPPGRDQENEEYYISFYFYHYYSGSDNPMLLGTHWNAGCDLLIFVCGTKMPKKKSIGVSHLYKIMAVM